MWGSVSVVGLALLFGPNITLRSSVALAIAASFLAANVLGIVAGRQKIATLRRRLDALDVVSLDEDV
jgi:hypothetical protein